MKQRATIPNVEFAVSKPLIQSVSSLPPMEIQGLWEASSEFRNKFEQVRRELLSIVSDYCRGSWGETEIRVYLIPAESKIPSISDPLILKFRGDHTATLFLLVHELVHRYVQYSKDFEDRPFAGLSHTSVEAIVNLVALQVFSDIFGQGEANQAFESLASFVNTVDMTLVDEKLTKLKGVWYLKKQTLLAMFPNHCDIPS